MGIGKRSVDVNYDMTDGMLNELPDCSERVAIHGGAHVVLHGKPCCHKFQEVIASSLDEALRASPPTCNSLSTIK